MYCDKLTWTADTTTSGDTVVVGDVLYAVVPPVVRLVIKSVGLEDICSVDSEFVSVEEYID